MGPADFFAALAVLWTAMAAAAAAPTITSKDACSESAPQARA